MKTKTEKRKLPSGLRGFTNAEGVWVCTGAQMGRSDNMPHPGNNDLEAPWKLHLVRLRWVDGDYDEGGAYWGGGQGDSIFWAYGDVGDTAAEIFVRARTRAEAKAKVRARLLGARFFN